MNVDEILDKTRNEVKNGKYDMVPTEKNRRSRWKYGLSMYDIEEFLCSIEKGDLFKGPVQDYNFPNEDVFIFKKEIIPGIIFYVKIKEKDNIIKILSCHEDE